MGGRTKRLKAGEVEKLLKKYGFIFKSQKGSHRKWVNPKNGLIAVVPWFGNNPLPIGTLMSIMSGAKIPEEEWR